MASSDFQIFTSLRYDPALLQVHSHPDFTHASWNHGHSSPFYMLDYHRDRMLRAAHHWKWDSVISSLTGDVGLQLLADNITAHLAQKDQPARVRVNIFQNGKLTVTSAPVPSVPLSRLFPTTLDLPTLDLYSGSVFEVVVDTTDNVNPSEFTHYKTSQRQVYEEARQRAGITSPTISREVLIVDSKDGSVMEGSISTPYFFRDGKWVTPFVNKETDKEWHGGQDGTTRRWALERGLVVEEVVLAQSLVDGEKCWLSTGVRGFILGRVKLNP
ncbi:Aminodeoxychorismate lyase [Podospora bellae-mahoneyi]|uniref:Aminodeoxychorismate lyase n=1 Tax=Podospora bellae-mahoneyi TaxID=2093777 RepID=A0ABR0FSQ7_9PEZI|nr:Aminodeoxychorismate lyase [Podospora bellae-mahoneyi]